MADEVKHRDERKMYEFTPFLSFQRKPFIVLISPEQVLLRLEGGRKTSNLSRDYENIFISFKITRSII